MPDDPLTPYAGTSGWSGSETSRQRAEEADSSGSTSKRQHQVHELVYARGERGITVRELRAISEMHHGSASGVLSVLHKTGLLARLSETRDRCKVYVHPDYVQGREIEPHGRRRRPSAVFHDPPSGWYTFGTHAGWEPVHMPREIEFSNQKDEAGMPLWERVVRR